MLSARDQKLYTQAMKLAELSECDSRHGAIVARGSNVLSMGINKYKTHPVSRRYSGFDGCSVHAEQRALILARGDVRGCTLYSARANGSKASKPCVMCAELMRDAGIRFVVYFSDGEIIRERIY